MPEPATDLADWIGRQETRDDTIVPTPVEALNATLDHPPLGAAAGLALPPLWHWLFFLPLHRQCEIGTDGHAARGGFLPPVPLPRRLWAGSAFVFRTPLHVGEQVRRVSTVEDVTRKDGRSGALVFVRVRHELTRAGDATPAIVEHHDIVYRDAPGPGETEAPPRPAPADADWRRTLVPDDVLLFRYSALTFNAHRIHYDRRYATEVEGYPGLVVHGPLIATLLLDLVRRNVADVRLAAFRFRALRPSFDGRPLVLAGRRDGATIHLWAADDAGRIAVDARAETVTA